MIVILHSYCIVITVCLFPLSVFRNQDEQILIQIKSLHESTQWYYVRCYGEEGKFKAITELHGALDIGQTIIFYPVSEDYLYFWKLSYYTCILTDIYSS